MRIDTGTPGGMPEDEMAATDEPTDQTHPPGDQDAVELAEALRLLHQAAAGKHVDPICRAYAALRRAAGTMSPRDVLALAGERLNIPAAALVIAAYAHRRCYMCDDGTVPCDVCEGTAQDDAGHPCPHCDGLGLATCDFCGGTGWADRDEIPPELATAVAKRQLAHVTDELKELQRSVAKLGRDDMDRMPPDQRGALAGRLIRLQARLDELGRCGVCDKKHAAHIAELGKRVGIILQALRC